MRSQPRSRSCRRGPELLYTPMTKYAVSRCAATASAGERTGTASTLFPCSARLLSANATTSTRDARAAFSTMRPSGPAPKMTARVAPRASDSNIVSSRERTSASDPSSRRTRSSRSRAVSAPDIRFVLHRFARRALEVDPFALDDIRPLAHLRLNRADVLAEDSHRQQLDRTEKEQADDQRRDADGEVRPEQQLVA